MRPMIGFALSLCCALAACEAVAALGRRPRRPGDPHQRAARGAANQADDVRRIDGAVTVNPPHCTHLFNALSPILRSPEFRELSC